MMEDWFSINDQIVTHQVNVQVDVGIGTLGFFRVAHAIYTREHISSATHMDRAMSRQPGYILIHQTDNSLWRWRVKGHFDRAAQWLLLFRISKVYRIQLDAVIAGICCTEQCTNDPQLKIIPTRIEDVLKSAENKSKNRDWMYVDATKIDATV